jgi:hypothetical protein
MPIRLLFLGIAVLLLQACSGIRVSQDYDQSYDFATLKTFTWKPNENNEYGVADNDLLDERIRTAVVDNLSAKGFSFLESGSADFLVSYHFTVEQKLSTSGATGAVSIGGYRGTRYGGIAVGTGTEVRAYDEGRLSVDITDQNQDKLVWRGISTQTVSTHSDPEQTTQRINETIEKILAQFPPVE